MRRITFEERRRQVVALREQGLSLAQIAAALGLKSTGHLGDYLEGVPPPDWTKRPNAKDELRDRAIELRLKGLSYREIREQLNVSKSSLSLWLRDVPLTPLQQERLKDVQLSASQRAGEALRANRIRREAETMAAAAADIGVLTTRELFIAGVALYWAEGSKSKPWRSSARVVFINSDPDVIRVFLASLELIGVDRDRLQFRLSIHKSADLAAAHAFWADVVGVPASEFARPTLKRHNPRSVRKNTGERYNGCVVVYVRRSSELYRQIAGWWRGIVSAAGTMTNPSGMV